MYVCKCVCIYACVHAYVFVCTYVCLHCMYLCMFFKLLWMHVSTYAYTYACPRLFHWILSWFLRCILNVTCSYRCIICHTRLPCPYGPVHFSTRLRPTLGTHLIFWNISECFFRRKSKDYHKEASWHRQDKAHVSNLLI
jgi:hypothetical protein